MNKTNLIDTVAVKANLKKAEAKAAVEAVFAALQEALVAGDTVALTGFGTFEVKTREAREGRNPATGDAMTIPASKAPVFKAGKALKDAVNQ